MNVNKGLHFLRTNFDTAAIIAAIAAISYSDHLESLGDAGNAVLAALRRSVPALENAPLSEIRSYLQSLNETQVPGLVSNVKGVLHEMEFVRVENEDGDSVYASYFDATNHPDTDIQLIDIATGETWEVQLKATESVGYVEDWIEEHPEGEILVTDELAERMDLPTSGQSNDELTTNVRDFVDRILDSSLDQSFWEYFPALGIAAIALAVWELWRRYKSGEIDSDTFQMAAARVTGLKLAKIGSIGLLLSLPFVGQVTGALLVASLLMNAKEAWFESRGSELIGKSGSNRDFQAL